MRSLYCKKIDNLKYYDFVKLKDYYINKSKYCFIIVYPDNTVEFCTVSEDFETVNNAKYYISCLENLLALLDVLIDLGIFYYV